MIDEKPRVIIIPAKPELAQEAVIKRQLRVAAYCRVSTEEEEQASSYEAQCQYYTDKIMSNKEWTMAGIFADEGISGTSTKKRTEFLRMIRQCRQKKIDLILTKSIQRFARNTLDCINYTRILRQLGIGVFFEKENINSLPPDSEFMITMYGAMAQSESESISGNVKNVRWRPGRSPSRTRIYMRMKRARTANQFPFQRRPRSFGSFTRAILPVQASGNSKIGWNMESSLPWQAARHGRSPPLRVS